MDTEKIENILNDLDEIEKYVGLVEEIVDACNLYEQPYEQIYDENNNFIHKDLLDEKLKKEEIIKDLTEEEYDLIIKMIIRKIIHRIEAKHSAYEQAILSSSNEEYKETYGDQTAAFNHLFEHYLAEYNYYKSMKDMYEEYVEETKTK